MRDESSIWLVHFLTSFSSTCLRVHVRAPCSTANCLMSYPWLSPDIPFFFSLLSLFPFDQCHFPSSPSTPPPISPPPSDQRTVGCSSSLQNRQILLILKSANTAAAVCRSARCKYSNFPHTSQNPPLLAYPTDDNHPVEKYIQFPWWKGYFHPDKDYIYHSDENYSHHPLKF